MAFRLYREADTVGTSLSEPGPEAVLQLSGELFHTMKVMTNPPRIPRRFFKPLNMQSAKIAPQNATNQGDEVLQGPYSYYSPEPIMPTIPDPVTGRLPTKWPLSGLPTPGVGHGNPGPGNVDYEPVGRGVSGAPGTVSPAAIQGSNWDKGDKANGSQTGAGQNAPLINEPQFLGFNPGAQEDDITALVGPLAGEPHEVLAALRTNFPFTSVMQLGSSARARKLVTANQAYELTFPDGALAVKFGQTSGTDVFYSINGNADFPDGTKDISPDYNAPMMNLGYATEWFYCKTIRSISVVSPQAGTIVAARFFLGTR
jgi:hypothetical protein